MGLEGGRDDGNVKVSGVVTLRGGAFVVDARVREVGDGYGDRVVVSSGSFVGVKG